MLDIALLTANASQLRYVLGLGEQHEFYEIMLGLIITSITLQVRNISHICIKVNDKHSGFYTFYTETWNAFSVILTVTMFQFIQKSCCENHWEKTLSWRFRVILNELDYSHILATVLFQTPPTFVWIIRNWTKINKIKKYIYFFTVYL